ncbi:MAG TPA: hypothetical protein VKB93_25520 [Thermoanaerobaculia bacterium]|nr:hypothetical protein [Thermoanaerobaculia bacterium]
MRTRALLVSLVLLLVALGAFAQSDNEFGRASSGAIDAITKGPSQFSGSLSLSTGGGHGASFGGEAIKDRLWVFAAAAVLPQIHFSESNAVDAKATAQPVDWANVTASFRQMRSGSNDALLPSSFLSLRSTAMLSDRMMMSISYSRSGR